MKHKKTLMDKIPGLSPELLRVLDEMYPERCPATDLSHAEMCRRTGQREVIRKLHEIYNLQTKGR